MRAFAVFLCCLFLAISAVAQPPQLGVSTTVVDPGVSVAVTIQGTPGRQFALLGSTTGAGLEHGGVALSPGRDFVILAIGALNGAGQAVMPVTPPFVGTTLDRYSIQAVTSTSEAFIRPTGGTRSANVRFRGS